MKKLFVLIFCFFSLSCFALTFSLKDSVNICRGNDVYLSDIVIENVPSNKNICIIQNHQNIKRLNVSDLIETFALNDIYDLTIFGSDVVVYPIDQEYFENVNSYKNENQPSKLHPIQMIEQYLSKYIDNLEVKIAIQKIQPQINLDEVDDYQWELNKIKSDINEIANLKRVGLVVNEKKYQVYLDVKLYGKIYLANKPHRVGESISQLGWTVKKVDIALYKDCKDILTDITKSQGCILSQNVSVGDILHWSYIQQTPLVNKGESLVAISNKDKIKLTLPCVAIKDSYLNEKVKVKLLNGNEIIGILNKDKTVSF